MLCLITTSNYPVSRKEPLHSHNSIFERRERERENAKSFVGVPFPNQKRKLYIMDSWRLTYKLYKAKKLLKSYMLIEMVCCMRLCTYIVILYCNRLHWKHIVQTKWWVCMYVYTCTIYARIYDVMWYANVSIWKTGLSLNVIQFCVHSWIMFKLKCLQATTVCIYTYLRSRVGLITLLYHNNRSGSTLHQNLREVN